MCAKNANREKSDSDEGCKIDQEVDSKDEQARLRHAKLLCRCRVLAMAVRPSVRVCMALCGCHTAVLCQNDAS